MAAAHSSSHWQGGEGGSKRMVTLAPPQSGSGHQGAREARKPSSSQTRSLASLGAAQGGSDHWHGKRRESKRERRGTRIRERSLGAYNEEEVGQVQPIAAAPISVVAPSIATQDTFAPSYQSAKAGPLGTGGLGHQGLGLMDEVMLQLVRAIKPLFEDIKHLKDERGKLWATLK